MTETEQRDIAALAFIRSHFLEYGTVPSTRAICDAVGYRSPRSGQLLKERLERRGWVKFSNGTVTFSSRNPVETERTVPVPVLGAIACGSPSLAEQLAEGYVQVSSKLAKPGAEHFLLRARGNSMNRSGIRDGDLVLVRRQSTAKQNERVVALINNEATIKHFRRNRGIVALHPNSTESSHATIIAPSDLLIQGVIVAVLPKDLWQRTPKRPPISRRKDAR